MAENLQKVADQITANFINTQKEVLTSAEAAAYMGVSISCLYKWTMNRVIPHFKPNGKLCYFNRLELEQWMQNNRVATAQELEQKAKTLAKKGGGR